MKKYAYLLCSTAILMPSAAFAQQLGRWRDDGRSAVSFVIGGADGLDDHRPLLREGPRRRHGRLDGELQRRRRAHAADAPHPPRPRRSAGDAH